VTPFEKGKGRGVTKFVRQFFFLPPYLLLWGIFVSLVQICDLYRIDLPDEPQGIFALVIRFENWLGYDAYDSA
jgi:hypothetical protein